VDDDNINAVGMTTQHYGLKGVNSAQKAMMFIIVKDISAGQQ
jgi:hypothetical protein